MDLDLVDELAKQIRNKFSQVSNAQHRRVCPWSDEDDEESCTDPKCDGNPCDGSKDTIILTLKKD